MNEVDFLKEFSILYFEEVNMMKVIFLDIDGVLNSYEYFDKIENLNVQGIEREIDVNKIKLLKRAVDETKAKVVLTSSWRYTKKAK